MIMNKLTLTVLTLALISSCVGTVEETQKKSTSISAPSAKNFSFEGIAEALGIAHNRIEIYFYPAIGDPDKIVYQVTYDGIPIPITINGSLLSQDYKGRLRYVIHGLDVNTSYSVKVEAKDLSQDLISNSKVVITTTTKRNQTADFEGIGSVNGLAGIAGINGIEIKWPNANIIGTTFSPNEIDVTHYEITLLNSKVLGYGDFDNLSFSEPNRKVISIAGNKVSAVINGLQDATKYLVRVRAFHHGHTQNSADPSYQIETNHKYLDITTFTKDLSEIDFDLTSLNLELASGSTGLNTININWLPAIGVFDHYRVYYNGSGATDLEMQNYNADDICNGQEINNPNFYCKEVHYTTNNKEVTDLLPHTNYNFLLAVCQSLICENAARIISSPKELQTSPPVAIFGGISKILFSQDMSDLNYLDLNINAPLLSSGIMDGLLIEYKGDDQMTPTYLNHPLIPNTSNLEALSFDYVSDTFLRVRGIDIDANINYCFSVIPFYYNTLGNIVEYRDSEVIKCIIPEVKAPTETEFSGIISCTPVSNGFISLSWASPLGGHFQSYDIYYKAVDASTFSYTAAILGDASYTKVQVSYLETDQIIPFLLSGENYLFGIISTSQYGGQIYRSELNSGIVSCKAN